MDKLSISHELCKEWINLNNVKIGTKVKIARWVKDPIVYYSMYMKKCIGVTSVVTGFGFTGMSIIVEGWAWDYRSLEVVEKGTTYKIGDRFKRVQEGSMYHDNIYELQKKDEGIVLFNIGRQSGQWSFPVKVIDINNISEEEFSRITYYQTVFFEKVLEETYEVGDLFEIDCPGDEYHNNYYMIVRRPPYDNTVAWKNFINMINLRDRCPRTGSHRVNDYNNITKEEFIKLAVLSGGKFEHKNTPKKLVK